MSAAPIRVLLLEDNPGDARLVQMTLATEAPDEFAITTAERLADALERIRTERFDAVLCDLGLPDSTGLGTAQAIVAGAPALPLVVLTGSHNEDLGRAAIQLGAQDYLVKGDTKAPTIARALRYAIERKRLENELHEANETLERRVAKRTAELETANTMLLASTARYHAINQTAADAIIIANAEGHVEGWNVAAGKLFGYTETEVLGTSLLRLMPERYRNGHLGGMGRVLAGGEPRALGRTVELHGLTKAGNEFPLELSLSQWQTAERIFFTGIIRDISERRRAEQALNASEARYRQLFEANPHPMWFFDPESLAFLSVNDAAVAHYGWSHEEFLAMTLADIRPPETIPDLLEHLATDNELGFRNVHSSKHRKKDGTLIDVEINSHIVDFGGRRARIASAYDITDRRRAEEALARQSHRNKAYLRNSSDGVHILDADGNVLEVSDSFCEMLGYTRDELIGANVSLWDAQWSAQELKRVIAEQIAKGSRSVLETRHRHWDGHIVDVEVTGQSLELEGRPVLFNSARDITERKKAQEENMRQLDELRRWQAVMIEREDRVMSLKREVNELLRRLGEPIRYPSQEEGASS